MAKSFQYKFYSIESQPRYAVDIDEHTKNYSEISKYLKYPHTEDMMHLRQLDEFFTVRNLYKKYNVIMPSEADIERLFSFGGMCYGYYS